MKPTKDKLLVKVTPAKDKTASGLVIPDIVKDSVQVQMGQVQEIGPNEGFFTVGMTIYFSKFSGSSVAIDGQVSVILANDEILAYEQ